MSFQERVTSFSTDGDINSRNNSETQNYVHDISSDLELDDGDNESEDFSRSTCTFIFHELSIADILVLAEPLERGCFM
jgi:hypothetical protein